MTRREELAGRTVPPGSAADGWLVETWVDHVLVESAPLGINIDVDAWCEQQLARVEAGSWWEVLVFDGDTGQLAVRLGSEPLDDDSAYLTHENIERVVEQIRGWHE